MEPKFGKCKDCACWGGENDTKGFCRRHPPVCTIMPDAAQGEGGWSGKWSRAHMEAEDGCWDFITKAVAA